MEDFKIAIMGNIGLGTLLAICFFGLIGFAISQLIDLNGRDKDSASTPTKFNLLFFIHDNSKKWLTSLLLFFVFIRFMPELLGIKINEFGGLLVGLSTNELAGILKKYFSVFQIKRDKYIDSNK
jgi:hypothetical protein